MPEHADLEALARRAINTLDDSPSATNGGSSRHREFKVDIERDADELAQGSIEAFKLALVAS